MSRFVKIFRRGFVADMSALMVGRVLGQAVSFAAIPILTRLYAPDAFGFAAIVVSLGAIIGGVGGLRMDRAIVLPRSIAASLNIAAFSIIAGVATALLCLAGFALLQPWLLARWHFSPEQFLLLALFAPTLGASHLLGEIVAQVALKTRRVRCLAALYASRPAVTVCVQGTFVLYAADPLGLISGYLVGGVFFALAGIFFLRRNLFGTAGRLRARAMIAAACRYRSFIIYNTPQKLFMLVGQNLPVFVLGAFFSPAVVGAWFLVRRALSAPTSLLCDTARQAMTMRAAERRRARQDLRAMYIKVLIGLLALCLPPAALLAAAGPEIVSVVFGDQWHLAGEFIAIFSIAWLTGILAMPAGVMIDVYGRHKIALIHQVAATTARTAALATGGILGDALLAIGLYAWTGAVFALGLIVYGYTLAAGPAGRAATALSNT